MHSTVSSSCSGLTPLGKVVAIVLGAALGYLNLSSVEEKPQALAVTTFVPVQLPDGEHFLREPITVTIPVKDFKEKFQRDYPDQEIIGVGTNVQINIRNGNLEAGVVIRHRKKD